MGEMTTFPGKEAPTAPVVNARVLRPMAVVAFTR